jgi:hypothetical protein
MGIFRSITNDHPEPFGPGKTAKELEAEAEKWGRLARKHALDEDPLAAQFAREARARALKDARKLRSQEK